MGKAAPAGFLLALSPFAFGLNPALDVSQYAHFSWKYRDGLSKGVIAAIAQTPDGYLWLGTEFGLLRFDGIKPLPWQPPRDQHLPSEHVSRLLAAHDGTLWIGTMNGLASWKNGKLTQYPELAGSVVFALLEDHEGSIWAGAFAISSGKLCEIKDGNVRCSGEDGRFGTLVNSLSEDDKGNLWVGVRTGVWRWKPDPPKFTAAPGDIVSRILGEADDGAVLIRQGEGIRRVAEDKTEAYRLPGTSAKLDALEFLRDRDGGLWMTIADRGLLHLHQGRTDAYALADGLSGDAVIALFEDREGNIWVSTTDGLDRFRDVAIPTFSERQGLPGVRSGGVLAAEDGSIWLAAADGLIKWSEGGVTIYAFSRTAPRKSGPFGAAEVRSRGSQKPGMPSGVGVVNCQTWLTR